MHVRWYDTIFNCKYIFVNAYKNLRVQTNFSNQISRQFSTWMAQKMKKKPIFIKFFNEEDGKWRRVFKYKLPRDLNINHKVPFFLPEFTSFFDLNDKTNEKRKKPIYLKFFNESLIHASDVPDPSIKYDLIEGSFTKNLWFYYRIAGLTMFWKQPKQILFLWHFAGFFLRFKFLKTNEAKLFCPTWL